MGERRDVGEGALGLLSVSTAFILRMSFVSGHPGSGRLRQKNASSMSSSRDVISICLNKTEAESVAASAGQLEPRDTNQD